MGKAVCRIAFGASLLFFIWSLGSVICNAALGPRAECDSASVSLGEIPSTQKVSRVFRIRNRSYLPLKIVKIRSGCGCTKVTRYTDDGIVHGRDGIVEVEFNPAGLHGKVVRTIWVETNAASDPAIPLSITATVLTASEKTL